MRRAGESPVNRQRHLRHSDKEKFRSDLDRPRKLQNVGTAVENIAKIRKLPSIIPSATNIKSLLKPPLRIAI